MDHFLSRRAFVAGAAALAAARPATADPVDARPPTIDGSNPRQIADGVWIIPDHRIWLVPNIGIILGRDAALIVDCGLGPANGERVLALARQIAGARRLMLTVTHFHPEHGYGAQVFRPEATIVYNRDQRDELERKGDWLLNLFRKAQAPAAVAALDDTRIVMPHFVYDGSSAEIDLGDRKVELHNWNGAAHTRGDQVVFLPKERILFAGDLIEERMFPIFPWAPPDYVDVDAIRWSNILNDFQRFAPSLIVPGHGDPGNVDIALNLASYIDDVGRRTRAARGKGLNADQIVSEIKPGILASYPSWEHPRLIDQQIRYFAAQPA